jgi:DNA-binding transcriptional LysR family regulator
VRALPLLEDRFGLVCAADHPLNTRAEPPEISDVVTGSFVRNALCELIQTPRFLTAIEAADVTIQNTHSLITMIRTGKWVTVLPETVAQFIPETTAFRPISDLHDKRQVFLYVREKSRYAELTEECSTFILSRPFD